MQAIRVDEVITLREEVKHLREELAFYRRQTELERDRRIQLERICYPKQPLLEPLPVPVSIL